MKPYIKEACVETFNEAIKAESLGADRIELCSQLLLDGLTPKLDLIEQLYNSLKIPIKVMVRPRDGNFIYSDIEIEEMKNTIQFCKEIGVFGVVFGVLNNNKELDIEKIKRLSAKAKPMNVCIHKAIDETDDIIKETNELCKIKEVNSILTSGKAVTALEGRFLLQEMMRISKNKLTVIPAGKVTNKNIKQLHKTLSAKEYHGRKIVGNLN
ncbi:copper homeostasis protein CutC [Bacteroidota bacterium]